MILKLLLLVLSALFSDNAHARSTNSTMLKLSKPEVRLQYAGNLGLMSLGVGKDFSHPKISMGLSYGYLPKSVNGAEVHTFALKSTFYITKKNFKNLSFKTYTGVTTTYSVAKNTYTEYPSYFPAHYHVPNAAHINPLLGIRLGYSSKQEKSNDIFIFAELGTVDYLLLYAVRNRIVSFREIVNLCFGLAVQPK